MQRTPSMKVVLLSAAVLSPSLGACESMSQDDINTVTQALQAFTAGFAGTSYSPAGGSHGQPASQGSAAVAATDDHTTDRDFKTPTAKPRPAAAHAAKVQQSLARIGRCGYRGEKWRQTA